MRTAQWMAERRVLEASIEAIKRGSTNPDSSQALLIYR
jgi:hypothetical protein